MTSEVGSGQVAIFPTFKGFRSKVTNEVDGAGKEASSRFGKVFSQSAGTAGRSSGKAFSTAFNTGAGSLGADSAKKLQATVASTSKALSAARLQEQDAAGKVRVAEAALNEARSKGEATSSRVIAAEERLEAAKRKLAGAQDKTKASSDDLRSAQQQLADATEDAGESSTKAAGRFARGWDGLKSKLGISKAVKAEADDAAREADRGGKSSGGAFSTAFKGALAGLAAVVSVQAVGSLFKDAITDAAELEQSVGAVSAIFKDGAGDINAWASTAATDVGLTKNEFNELGTLIGAQLKNGGTAMDELAPKTNNLIGLGADLASMFGGTTADAVGALSSALKGERDPIERYGVSLSQAKIDAEAAALGFEKVDGALSAEAQQAATLSLIMQQTADSHGNFAKEANTLAGQQQRLTSLWGDAKATLGTALLPAITSVVSAMVAGFPRAQAVATAIFTEITGGFRAMVAAFKAGDGDITSAGFAGFLERVGAVARIVFDALSPLGAAIAGVFSQLGPSLGAALPLLTPFGLIFQALLPVLPQIVALLAGLITQLGPVLAGALTGVLPLVQQLVQVLAGVFVAVLPTVSTLIGILSTALGQIIPVVAGVLAAVLPLISTLIGQLAPIFLSLVTAILPPVISIFASLVTAIAPLITQIAETLIPIIQALMPVVVTVFGVIAEVVKSAMQIVQGIIQVVTGAISGDWSLVWTGIQNILQGAWKLIVSVVTGAINIVLSIIQAVLGTIGRIWNDAWNGLGRFIGQAWETIKLAVRIGIDNVVNFVSGLPDKIMGAIGDLGGLLLASGQSLINGFLEGIRSIDIGGAIEGVMQSIRDFFPFSPAKKGPFSGRGYTTYSGRALVDDFAEAMEGRSARVQRAAALVTGAAALAGSSNVAGGAGGSGAGGVTVYQYISSAENPEVVADLGARKIERALRR